MQQKGVLMTDVVLHCNKICKKVNHHVLVNNISFTLNTGDIVGLIGPNGAGKTTTMKLLVGLQTLNGGTITIAGHDLKKEFPKAISHVGAIIENPDLYMYLSGYDNLKLAAKLYNIKEQRILEVLKIVGLETKMQDKVKKYSLGMRQRLGIAQAILHNPRLLILDEPMNGLDPEGIKELKELLLKLASTNQLAILISSHLLSELESFCNRICMINNGKLIEDISMADLQKRTEQVPYILEVSRINLEQILSHYEVLDQTHIKVLATKEQITNILKTLLLNDILILELKKELISLEDLFLQKMKVGSYD